MKPPIAGPSASRDISSSGGGADLQHLVEQAVKKVLLQGGVDPSKLLNKVETSSIISQIKKEKHESDDDVCIIEDETTANRMVISSGSVEKSSVKYDDLQQDSPVKRRLRNLDMRRKAIEMFEVEVTDFVRDFLRAKYAEKFPSSESLYEYSIQIVKDKILQPEITSYSKVIEQGGSWMEFKMNRAIEENVKMYLVQKM